MANISVHTVSVNVPAVQRSVVQYRPIVRVQQVARPQTNIDETKVVRVSHPVNDVHTVENAQTISRIVQVPQTISDQDVEGVTESSDTSSTSYASGSVDIYA